MKEPFAVDFAKHAEAMGALARRVESLADLEKAMEWARQTDRTTVIAIETDPFRWVPGDADWDVGVPQVSERGEVRAARRDHDAIRAKQRIGV
ncbi:MAG: thiamine pyrophosphate-dependent enzyme [Paracoccaceae bacterium]